MRMHPYQVLAGFLGFLLVTSKEIIWLRPWIGDSGFNLIVSALFSVHFLLLFTRYRRDKAVLVIRPKLQWKRWPGINFLLGLCAFSACYFIFHEIVVGDSSRALKFGVYLLFLGSLLCDSYDLENLPKVFVSLSTITCVALIVQFLLVVFVLDNDLSNQPRLIAFRANGEFEFNDANPFWLGLIGDTSLVDYGIFQFHRANAYTTEPKYCSQVLITGLVSLCLIKDLASQKRILLSVLFCVGLLISHAYSTVPVLLLAYFIYRFGRSKHAFLYSLVTIAVLAGSVTLLISYSHILGGYASQRVNSFLTQADMLGEVLTHSAEMLGRGVYDERSLRVGVPPLLRFMFQFGWIGVLCWLTLLFTVLSKALRGMYLAKTPENRWALALAASLSMIFSFFFNSEPISPLYAYLFAIVFHITGNLELASSKVKIPMRAHYGKLSPDYSF